MTRPAPRPAPAPAHPSGDMRAAIGILTSGEGTFLPVMNDLSLAHAVTLVAAVEPAASSGLNICVRLFSEGTEHIFDEVKIRQMAQGKLAGVLDC